MIELRHPAITPSGRPGILFPNPVLAPSLRSAFGARGDPCEIPQKLPGELILLPQDQKNKQPPPTYTDPSKNSHSRCESLSWPEHMNGCRACSSVMLQRHAISSSES